MAKFIFSLSQSLDGYVDHMALPRPGPTLSRHFMEQARNVAGGIYGRRVYEIMRYWDEDQSEWDEGDVAFAKIWRKQPKWVVSRTLKSIGPNATLIADNVAASLRGLKAQLAGNVRIAGPDLARTLSELGLIDEYQLYIHPVVLGSGTPYFAAVTSPLRLTSNDLVGDGVIRLTYVPT